MAMTVVKERWNPEPSSCFLEAWVGRSGQESTARQPADLESHLSEAPAGAGLAWEKAPHHSFWTGNRPMNRLSSSRGTAPYEEARVVIKIPGKAVAVSPPGADDISPATTGLLRDLSLLPEKADVEKAGGVVTALTGPPDSVAVIEAGATAASKGWAALLAAGAAGWVAQAAVLWDRIGEDNPTNQPVTILSIAIVLAAAALGIAYLLGSDVRGRAAAMVATIEARRDVAAAMINAAQESYQPESAAASSSPVSLPGVLTVANGTKHGDAEQSWKAIAAREDAGAISFLLVKGTESEWVASKDVKF